jgi:hypothetical protein
MGEATGFEAWKQAVRRGEVFIASGPLIRFDVNGVAAGGIVHLPSEGGGLMITAELTSPRPLDALAIVKMGEPVEPQPEKRDVDGINRWTITHTLRVDRSCWLAARGTGGPKAAIEAGLQIKQNEIAHTGVVQVLVGEAPIRSEEDTKALCRQLMEPQEYYRTQGRYEQAADGLRFVELFERALRALE